MKNRNKAATAATAVVLSAALLMTGTFAWNDFSQKKLNELAGVLNYDVALVEDFEETSDWSFANPDVNKDVSAANKGDNAAYVRINLREYLQVRPFTYTNDSYVKDAKGNPVRFAVDKNGEYIPSTAADPKAFGVDFSGDIGVKYFVVAQGADQTIATMDSTNENGQIGKFMINPALPDGGKVYDADKVEHYGADKKAATTDEEMAYAIHKFTDTPDPWQTKVEEYVSWKMGPAVKTMAEYKALTADVKKDAKFWITDTDGWCYWSQPLAKDEQTTLLLDAATLKKAPKGDLYYAIHSTMQAVDKENLGWWAADATEDAKDSILEDLNDGDPVTPVVIATDISFNQSTLSLTNNVPVKLEVTFTPSNVEITDLVWKSTNEAVATVDNEGNVTAHGLGTSDITAKTTDGSNKSAVCHVTVTSWIPATGIKLNETNVTIMGIQSKQLQATVQPLTAANKNVTWSSNNPDVATVDENGKVTGQKKGSTLIVATTEDGGFYVTCSVTVEEVPTTDIVSPQHSYFVGKNFNRPFNDLELVPSPMNATDSITLTSSDPSIITIGSDNELIASGNQGEFAIITASAGTASPVTFKAFVANEIATFGSTSIQYDATRTRPLYWTVLEKKNGKALLMLEEPSTSHMRKMMETSSWSGWSNSDLHNYLHTEFLSTYFTEADQKRINPFDVVTRDVTTTDKFTILSIRSGDNYNVNDYPIELFQSTGSSWLRTEGNSSYTMKIMTEKGTVSEYGGTAVTTTRYVRPLAWITLP